MRAKSRPRVSCLILEMNASGHACKEVLQGSEVAIGGVALEGPRDSRLLRLSRTKKSSTALTYRRHPPALLNTNNTLS